MDGIAEYNEDYLRVMVRDPSWLFVYWELRSSTLARVKSEAEAEISEICWVLRIIRLENGSSRQLAVKPEACNWYVPVQSSSSYELELGLATISGGYRAVLRGNRVSTPPMGISRKVDPNWYVSDDVFLKLFAGEDHFGQLNPSSIAGWPWADETEKWGKFVWPASPIVSSHDVQKKAAK